MPKPIPFAELTAVEQTQFQAWTNEIQAIAQKSTRPSIVLKPPVLRVFSVPPKGGTHLASTDGKNFNVTRDLLPAALSLRRYMVAHELGHIEGLHPRITFIGGICAGLPLLMIKPYHDKWLGSHAFDIGMIAVAIGALGFVVILAKMFTMLFEWDADRRAARMTTVQTMLNGTMLIEQIRGAHTKPFYDNKRARLLGQHCSIWSPRI